MRFLRRSLAGLFLASLSVALLAWAGLALREAFVARLARDGGVRPAEERVFAANVIRVEPTTIAPVLTSFGEVRSLRSLELRATAGGTVIELSPNFQDGGAVAEGELLVVIDPSQAQSALEIAQTDLAEAEAGLREAERALILATEEALAAEAQAALQTRALDRARDLAERGVGSVAAVEAAEFAEAQAGQSVLARAQGQAQAEARLDLARTTLERRRIGLAEAERHLAETRITAEFGGMLADVVAVEGGLVTPNERLARLINPQVLEVSFRLSTSQYARLLDAEGRLVLATIEAVLEVFGADLVASGTITRESAAVGEGQTGRLLFASLDGASGFRAGDFVTIRITEPALDGVALLPASAVDGVGTVLALAPEDRLEVVQVTLLRRQGDDVIVAAEGLAGREVVAERSPLLGAGIRIRPIRAGESAAAPAPELLELTPERRAALIAFVESNTAMPAAAKARVLAELNAPKVSAEIVARIEARMGG